ncbi:MAG: hypothetical protein KDC34_15775 [Saprospiraceae bacterium]|nr:hypothetical protein [Saprospiraceae bacterium]
MSNSKDSNLIIYRMRDNGLEVFLLKLDDKVWQLPKGTLEQIAPEALAAGDGIIELDPVEQEGIFEQAYAVEGDWHDIPSMKSIIRHDMRYMKDTIKQLIPDMMEKGAFVAVKDAFKKVLPHQYDQLKELKEILIDRNLTKYM